MNYTIFNTGKRVLATALFATSVSAVMAQTITLKGNVKDDTGEWYQYRHSHRPGW